MEATQMSVFYRLMVLVTAYLSCNREQLLSDQWRSAVSSCRGPLERDDLLQVLDYDSWDDLQDQIAKGRGDELTYRSFAMLAPGLIKMKTFIELWISKVGPRVDTSGVWGFTRLLIKVGDSLTVILACPAS
jgi:hypothetical protein